MDIQEMETYVEGVDIQHYGRLGMKWYQHKFGDTDGRARYLKKGFSKAEKHYKKAEKASKKIEKLSSDVINTGTKARGLQLKAESQHLFKRLTKFRANRAKKKFKKLAAKYDKAANEWYKHRDKGMKLTTKMESIFGEVRMSELDSRQRAIGEEFCMSILNDSWNRRKSS